MKRDIPFAHTARHSHTHTGKRLQLERMRHKKELYSLARTHTHTHTHTLKRLRLADSFHVASPTNSTQKGSVFPLHTHTLLHLHLHAVIVATARHDLTLRRSNQTYVNWQAKVARGKQQNSKATTEKRRRAQKKLLGSHGVTMLPVNLECSLITLSPSGESKARKHPCSGSMP